MGDKTFTFTGLLEDEPKKEQVVTTVKVPRFEYARLVAAKAKLDMIEKMGFTDYFLIVSDFVRYAKSRGIPVGPGRGSAAGSMVFGAQ